MTIASRSVLSDPSASWSSSRGDESGHYQRNTRGFDDGPNHLLLPKMQIEHGTQRERAAAAPQGVDPGRPRHPDAQEGLISAAVPVVPGSRTSGNAAGIPLLEPSPLLTRILMLRH